ncbi:hypothetical protein PPACK8108_LOCUS3753 [Phakopsora pachyrhizi]|uniref:Uncharacterized protein n=1 Tax=Phakopsora pachyrhizi TaxID=170000 RepID=A0AAV0ALV6_PHAPC|nr:hypothetical protein PPACK8108_LOCUS3753 [Phakopsora pachyrhizi]
MIELEEEDKEKEKEQMKDGFEKREKKQSRLFESMILKPEQQEAEESLRRVLLGENEKEKTLKKDEQKSKEITTKDKIIKPKERRAARARQRTNSISKLNSLSRSQISDNQNHVYGDDEKDKGFFFGKVSSVLRSQTSPSPFANPPESSKSTAKKLQGFITEIITYDQARRL